MSPKVKSGLSYLAVIIALITVVWISSPLFAANQAVVEPEKTVVENKKNQEAPKAFAELKINQDESTKAFKGFLNNGKNLEVNVYSPKEDNKKDVLGFIKLESIKLETILTWLGALFAAWFALSKYLEERKQQNYIKSQENFTNLVDKLSSNDLNELRNAILSLSLFSKNRYKGKKKLFGTVQEHRDFYRDKCPFLQEVRDILLSILVCLCEKSDTKNKFLKNFTYPNEKAILFKAISLTLSSITKDTLQYLTNTPNEKENFWWICWFYLQRLWFCLWKTIWRAGEAQVSFIDLSNQCLKGVQLQGVDLRGANLFRCNLQNANLIGADLRGINLIEADLTDANLTGTDLTEVDLIGVDLTGADLTNTIINKNITNENAVLVAINTGLIRWY